MLTIRKISASRPVVLSSDPALNRPVREAFGADGDKEFAKAEAAFAEKWEAYLRGYDLSLLPVKPGAQLSVFYVAPLTSEQLAAIDDAKYGPGGEIRVGSYMRELLAYGIRDVAIREELDDGSTAPYKLVRVKGPLGEQLPESLLAWLMRHDDIRGELFAAVRRACSLDPEAAKSGPSDLVDARPT